jgi:Potential Queuosine, Q, salvage protein family
MPDPLGVREACAWVTERARSVRLGGVEAALDAIAPLPVPPWDGSRHFSGDPERTLAYLVVLDTLNFSFWGGTAGGYWELATRLRDVFRAGDRLERPSRLAAITAVELRDLLGDLPMLEERAAALREVGARGFAGLVGPTAVETVRTLASELPSFADVAEYDGRSIPLLKRAQILASDLHGAGVRAFPDISSLTCFADYKLPQMLRHWGAIVYSDDLASRVDARQPLPAGSPAEVEIRAATVVTVERLRHALASRGRPLTSVEVDWILWEASQDQTGLSPYHRTRTTFY